MTERTFAEFNAHCEKIEAHIEHRRAIFKKRFLALLVATTLSIIALTILLLASVGTGERFYTILVVGILLILGLLRFTSMQTYRYKNSTYKAGKGDYIVSKDYSLKETTYEDFLAHYGEFKVNKDAAIAAYEIENSELIPDYDEYSGEDFISGVYKDFKVEICEARLTNYIDKKPIDYFKGMFILIDICELGVKLRGDFKGRTVLIKDDLKLHDSIKDKYNNYERFDLPNAILEEKFEAFTTNKEEAEKLLSEEFLSKVEDLSNQLLAAKEQVHHREDKALYAIENILMRVSNLFWYKILFVGNIIFGRRRPAQEVVDLHKPFDANKHNQISAEVGSINDNLQIAAYKDKLLITIPYEGDLFEPNSIFEKPIVMEDKKILFSIMKVISSAERMLDDMKS